jgi:hypothetical protein
MERAWAYEGEAAGRYWTGRRRWCSELRGLFERIGEGRTILEAIGAFEGADMESRWIGDYDV